MKQQTLNKYIGLTKGVLTVISLDHEDYDSLKQIKRSYFQCKCNRCGNKTIVRADRFGKGSYTPKSCSHCITDLQKEIAEEKYKIKGTRSIRKRINSIKSGAKSRNIDFKLTDTQIKKIISKSCFYCSDEHSNGIDRIDSLKGYTENNCVPCCSICNRMKNKFTLDLFLNKISLIYRKFHNESSTTIPKGSTLQANGNGNGETLNAA